MFLLDLSSPSFLVKSVTCGTKYLLSCMYRMTSAVTWICLAEVYNRKIGLNLHLKFQVSKTV